MTSILHLERLPLFRRRVVDLNRVHDPDNDLHDAILLETDAWEAFQASPQANGLLERAVHGRRGLAAIHKSFPATGPLHEQAAYLVRAFNGVRPFDQANHPTAWDYLGGLAAHHGHALLVNDEEGRSLGNEVWDRIAERHGADGFGRDLVAERDGTFEYLTEWFRHRIG